MRSWLAVTLAICAGCSHDPGPEPITPAQAEDLCATSCDYDVVCQEEDAAICVDDCVTELGTWARHDAIATVSECRGDLSCDDDTEICLEQVKPLAYHRKFEDSCRTALAECATIDVDLDCAVEYSPDSDAIGFFRFMAEPVIVELTACFEAADCQARLDCMDAIYVERGINF